MISVDFDFEPNIISIKCQSLKINAQKILKKICNTKLQNNVQTILNVCSLPHTEIDRYI